MNKHKLVISSAYAAILTIVFVVVITVWVEFSVLLKDSLKNFSGHHWTSKSIFSVALYGVATLGLYLSPFKYEEQSVRKSIRILIVGVAIGISSLALFFTGHYFQIF